MASFLSNPTQFAPSRDPFNLQLYAQIGTERQRSYESGIQRVQGVYDTVAGLKMGRPEDTEYLNQKLAGLQTNIQKLAGSDFSQANVVSQAAGYASMIYNDQRIVKDVISAQNASDAQNQIQEARKNGKSAASNDNAVMRNINAWQQGGADASLGKQQYTPYYNYSKSWQDFMSGKHANTVYWESDGSGRSDRGIAYTLNQGKKTYIDPATVQRDFETFLTMDAQAQGQVQLDALYYSDRTPDEVAFQGIRNNAAMTLQSYDQSIQQLQQQKVTNNTPSDIAQIDDQIEAINAAKSKLTLRINNGDLEREFIQNPEQGKMQLFMRGLTVGAGNRYAYSEIENKTVKNPVFEADLDMQKLNIAQNHLLLQEATEKRLQAKDDREVLKDLQESQGIMGGGVLIGTGGYDSSEIAPEEIISDVNAQGAESRQQQLKMLFATGQYSDLIQQGQDSNGRVKYTVPQGRENDFIRAWEDVYDSFQKNPESADPNVRKYFESVNNPNYGLGLLRSYTASKKQISKIQDDLAKKYPDYIADLSRVGNLDETLYTEGDESVTRRDLINLLNNEATKKVGTNASTIAKALNISETKADLLRRSVAGTPGTNIFGENIGQLKSEYDKLQALKSSGKKYDKEIRAAYKPVQDIRPTVSQIEAEDGANKKVMEDRFAAVQQIAAGLGEAQSNAVNDILNETTKGVPQRRSLNYQLLPDGKVNLTVRNASGKSYTLPLEQHQAQVLSPVLLQQDQNAVMNRLLNANRPIPGAPSITGKGGHGAFMPEYSNLKNYKLRYQVKDDGEGNYTPIIEYYKKGENVWRSLGNTTYFPSGEQVRSYINKIANFTDAIFEANFLSPNVQ